MREVRRFLLDPGASGCWTKRHPSTYTGYRSKANDKAELDECKASRPHRLAFTRSATKIFFKRVKHRANARAADAMYAEIWMVDAA